MSEDREATKRKRFSKRRKEEEFDLEEEDGTVAVYKLIALDGDGRTAFMGHVRDRKTADDLVKNSQIVGKLLSMTLHGPDGQLVSEQFTNKLPSPVQLELFEMAAEMSGVSKKGEDAAKNN